MFAFKARFVIYSLLLTANNVSAEGYVKVCALLVTANKDFGKKKSTYLFAVTKSEQKQTWSKQIKPLFVVSNKEQMFDLL